MAKIKLSAYKGISNLELVDRGASQCCCPTELTYCLDYAEGDPNYEFGTTMDLINDDCDSFVYSQCGAVGYAHVMNWCCVGFCY